MTDLNVVRDAVGDILDRPIDLETRDRIAESEEIMHLCAARQSLKFAARSGDQSDVWQRLDEIDAMIEQRLVDIEGVDADA